MTAIAAPRTENKSNIVSSQPVDCFPGSLPTRPELTSERSVTTTEIGKLTNNSDILEGLTRLNFSANPADRELIREVNQALGEFGKIRFVDRMPLGEDTVSASVRQNSRGGYDIIINRAALPANRALSSLTLGTLLSDEITHIQRFRYYNIANSEKASGEKTLSSLYSVESYSKVHQYLYLAARANNTTIQNLTWDQINAPGSAARINGIATLDAPAPQIDSSYLPPSIQRGSIAAALLGNITNYQSHILGSSAFLADDVDKQLIPENRLARLGASPEVCRRAGELVAYGSDPLTAVPAYKGFMTQLYQSTPAPVHPVVSLLQSGQDYPENLRESRSYEGLKQIATNRIVSDTFPAVRNSQSIDARTAAVPCAIALSKRLALAGLGSPNSNAEIITIPESLPAAYRSSPYTIEALTIKDPLIPMSKPITLLYVKSSDAHLKPLYVGSLPSPQAN